MEQVGEQKTLAPARYPDEPRTDNPHIDGITVLGDGLWFISTKGDVDFVKVTRCLNCKIPPYMRRVHGLYEEGEWCIPAVTLADHITEKNLKENIANGAALNNLRHLFPDAYEKWTGLAVQPGESMVRDKETLKKEHPDYFVSVNHAHFLDKVVAVECAKGGRDNAARSRIFMVPIDEYTSRVDWQARFVLGDPSDYEKRIVYVAKPKDGSGDMHNQKRMMCILKRARRRMPCPRPMSLFSAISERRVNTD